MGWSDNQRRARLNRVVGLSRFLIRGGCAHLASQVLGQVLRRLPGGFLDRYGSRPWVVETFAVQDQRRTSLQAANFLRIGATALAGGRTGTTAMQRGASGCMCTSWTRVGGAEWECRGWTTRRVWSRGRDWQEEGTAPASEPNGDGAGAAAGGSARRPGQAEGKSRRWIDGYREIGRAAAWLRRRTRLISVMDREADFFDLFRELQQAPREVILVCAKHNRKLDDKQGRKPFEVLAGGEADRQAEVQIEGLTERPKASRKKSRPAHRKRLASYKLRYRRLSLPPTRKRGNPVSLCGVHLVETDPPEGEKPVQWSLLTSLHVSSAEEVVEHYLQRWRIEDYFRVLKSSCGAKRLRFRTAVRLQRAIAIRSVIAWRLMVHTLLRREVSELEAEVLFTAAELDFLNDYAREHGLPAPDSLRAAMQMVAPFGRHRGRKHDHPPGRRIIWWGYSGLTTATVGHLVYSKWGGNGR